MMNGTTNPRYTIRRIIRTVGCREDHQCPTGFFCEVSQLSCRQCLSCTELNRQPLPLPANVTSCLISHTACGACFAGLVPSQAGNKCVSPDGQELLLPYEWAVIVVGLVLAAIICALAVYVLRNFDTFKLSTKTTVHSPVDVEANAAQLPPAYNVVAALPPAIQFPQDEERAPFIKAIPSPRTNDARESATRQDAGVFNNPAYVRILQPASDDSPNVQVTLPTIQETATDINSNEDLTSSANVMASEVEESGRRRQVARTPYGNLLQTRQEGDNNNGGEDARDCSFAQSGGTAFIINVIKNVNTLQQRNQLSL